ncbi:hypothetical protein HNY73_005312 [Argiope bruennichi]|uniref:Uncharacterized protein n=1 Tax=Argiope bruennichi TaxID=94029 RepID=A0A8T0FIP4_ARGBR|nr:hypothetical protein HNY73_005312 [Argiope bruennichi]
MRFESTQSSTEKGHGGMTLTFATAKTTSEATYQLTKTASQPNTLFSPRRARSPARTGVTGEPRAHNQIYSFINGSAKHGQRRERAKTRQWVRIWSRGATEEKGSAEEWELGAGIWWRWKGGGREGKDSEVGRKRNSKEKKGEV